jgi:hypothetical protein
MYRKREIIKSLAHEVMEANKFEDLQSQQEPQESQ